MPFSDTPANQQRLITSYGYTKRGAEFVSKRLMAITPALSKAVDQWWDTGALIEISVEDFSINLLKEEHGLNDIAAILTLDWLIKDPQAALRALEKGHDHVQ